MSERWVDGWMGKNDGVRCNSIASSFIVLRVIVGINSIAEKIKKDNIF